MHLLYRYLSLYVEFLQGLKKLRPRLLAFMALLAFACLSIALRAGAPPASRAVLAGAGALLLAALTAAGICRLMRDTLFIAGSPNKGISSHSPPLKDGEGVTARVSGRLELSRYGQGFSNVAGGVIREDDQLYVVAPNQAFHVLRGITAEHCRSWWRRTLDREIQQIEVGILWMGGRPLPALRFVRTRFDRITIGLVDPTAFNRVLQTLRALEYPMM